LTTLIPVDPELYRLLQEVEKIEKQFKNAPPEKKEEIKDKLRKIKAERPGFFFKIVGHRIFKAEGSEL